MSDEVNILIERYKIAITLFCNHDSILWRQSNIFLLSQIAIMGFALTLPMENIFARFLPGVVGIALALTWRFINVRRHHLMKTLIEWASKGGAKQIYVSVVPSESAVGFYLSEGFSPVDEPLPELLELEPEDIHMVKNLS